ncbi:hypothetical protein EVAR_95170_1 [Eumeta japonica]|uniref:Uncharacterized protein n=1 Tax=Eumeta variegata TaxID=151549 RepID=A0A4C1VK07_EUMVA|nr:hypothetical protein EVAR_95170_1 [Eumeta japonica]
MVALTHLALDQFDLITCDAMVLNYCVPGERVIDIHKSSRFSKSRRKSWSTTHARRAPRPSSPAAPRPSLSDIGDRHSLRIRAQLNVCQNRSTA